MHYHGNERSFFNYLILVFIFDSILNITIFKFKLKFYVLQYVSCVLRTTNDTILQQTFWYYSIINTSTYFFVVIKFKFQVQFVILDYVVTHSSFNLRSKLNFIFIQISLFSEFFILLFTLLTIIVFKTILKFIFYKQNRTTF